YPVSPSAAPFVSLAWINKPKLHASCGIRLPYPAVQSHNNNVSSHRPPACLRMDAMMSRCLFLPVLACLLLPSFAESRDFKITAKDHAHWSFQPVAKPSLPQVKNGSWPKSSLDYFVLSKLEAKGFEPVAAADKRALLRRVTFDLIGLPPTEEEIDNFLRDARPDGFARVVDRLLA